MKVKWEPTTVQRLVFNKINIGNAFTFHGDLYIKTNIGTKFNAIKYVSHTNRWTAASFNWHAEVNLLNTELIISERSEL